MAKFERRLRVDLDSYESKWKGAHIIVALLSFNVANDFDRDNRKLSKRAAELEKNENRSVEEDTELEELNEKFRHRLINLLSQQFRGGQIYDDTHEVLVDLTSDDMGDFDFEILTALSNIVLGRISDKKK